VEAVATAERSCLLVRVRSGDVATVTAFPFGGGEAAPATAVTAEGTIGGCYLAISPFFVCFFPSIFVLYMMFSFSIIF
jgi:hypothetical protein